jgi:hypothetical protein
MWRNSPLTRYGSQPSLSPTRALSRGKSIEGCSNQDDRSESLVHPSGSRRTRCAVVDTRQLLAVRPCVRLKQPDNEVRPSSQPWRLIMRWPPMPRQLTASMPSADTVLLAGIQARESYGDVRSRSRPSEAVGKQLVSSA